MKKKTTARFINGKLILSCPDALTPVVWQMDLNDVLTSSLEVVTNKAGDEFTLVLKTPGDENNKASTQDVAKFEQKESAIHALDAVSRAFASAQRAPSTGNDNYPRKGGAMKWVISTTVIILIIMVGGLSYISSQIRQSPELMADAAAYEQQLANDFTQPSVPASQETGVAVSADAFLNGK